MLPHFEWHFFSWLSPHLRSNTKNRQEKSDLPHISPFFLYANKITSAFFHGETNIHRPFWTPGLNELVPSQPCPPGSPRSPETVCGGRRLGDDARDERICPFFGGIYPTGSMYGIYASIGDILMVNVTIYSIHGSYGYIYIDIYVFLYILYVIYD